MQKVSFVIPALNEEAGIADVIRMIPVEELASMGFDTEIIVSDNASTDNTAEIARAHGAHVVYQPLPGYGNAYKMGIEAATGDIVITGDADMTYPFDTSPQLIRHLIEHDLDFLNTDRLSSLNNEAMHLSHVFGNLVLTIATKVLYFWPYNDSQSGMWIFKRSVWDDMDVRSGGMPFSQEIKIEAFMKGFKCAEVPIEYRPRVGEVKLNALKDGIRNSMHLLKKRLTVKRGKKHGRKAHTATNTHNV